MTDPATLIAAALPIPAPWGLFEALRLSLFYLHLIAMNILLGGACLAAFACGRQVALPEPAARSLSHVLPTVMALAVNLGVPPLLCIQVIYGQFFYTSSILMGWIWLSVVVVLIMAYSGLYLHDARTRMGAPSPYIRPAAALLALNAFIYVCNLSQTQDPAGWVRAAGAVSGTLLPLTDASLAPRYLHFLIGAVAVAGLALAAAGRSGWFTARDERTTAFGLRVFLAATMAQIVDGIWFMSSEPWTTTRLFLGADPFATRLFVAAALLILAALALARRRLVGLCVASVLCILAAMTLMREVVRLSRLAPYFHPQNSVVALETGPAILFGVVLASGLVALGWLVYQSRRAGKGA